MPDNPKYDISNNYSHDKTSSEPPVPTLVHLPPSTPTPTSTSTPTSTPTSTSTSTSTPTSIPPSTPTSTPTSTSTSTPTPTTRDITTDRATTIDSARDTTIDSARDTTINVDISTATYNTQTTVTDGSGYNIVLQSGVDISGEMILQNTFMSTQTDIYIPNISENFTETVTIYDDDTDVSGVNYELIQQIKQYANEIKCESFHGKGMIEDYTELFTSASKIANDTKQMELDIDIDGFNEFGQAADDLAHLFQSFTVKLQNINIINDTLFLTSVVSALSKILNLSKEFGKFKETILATSTISLPKSSYDARVAIQNVMSEVECAMNYIEYFVDASSNPGLVDAKLSDKERTIIQQAVATIDNWNIISEHGIRIGMSQNPDIKYIIQTNHVLKNKAITLQAITNKLHNKLKSLKGV